MNPSPFRPLPPGPPARRASLAALAGGCLLAALLVPPAEAQPLPPYSYEIEEIALPEGMVPEVSGVAFTPAGTLVIVNRHGEVWLNEDPPDGAWRLFAYGLHEPLGVLARSESEILVSQRPEITRLLDTDGDGLADRYETLSDDWCVTDNWHEFTYGLREDDEGNLYFSTALPDKAGPMNELHPRVPLDFEPVHEERKPSPGLYQGWALVLRPDGTMVPLAGGFRSPHGVGLSPEGEFFITDQQGDYIATSTLVHVQPGRFYGHPASWKWSEGYEGPLDLDALAELRTPEAVALPHGALGGSPGEPVWDTTGGRFGPFEGQIFIGDFTKLISRVYLEKIDGEYQGAAFPFLRDAVGLEAIQANSGRDNLTIPAGREGLRHFRDVPPREGTPLRPGNNRMAFAPDGSLYLAQTTRGWGQGDGMQRLVWSGLTPVEMHRMELTETGFRIAFTVPMDAAALALPDTWRASRFRYLYLPPGSPRADESDVELTAIRVLDDGMAVELDLADLEPGYIYEVEPWDLVAADGRPVENPLAYYTLNRLLDGSVFEGPMSVPLLEPETSLTDAPDLEDGRRLYAAFCATCHQADGSGGGLPGTPPELAASDLRARGEGAPLSKSDEELFRVIAEGPEGKPMPPFGAVLREAQLWNLVAYLRDAFGEKPGEVE